MVGRQAMRWVVPAIVAAAAPAPAGQAQARVAQAPSPTQAQSPAEAAPPPAAPPQAVQGQAQAAQPVPPPGPVFVIYPSNPPSRATILLNTLTGETWLLGVNGPDGQYQWTRIAVADPSETAAAPR